jgi:PAS domain S-box-containing protein
MADAATSLFERPLEAAVLDGLADSIAVYDRDGRILYMNAETERIFGKSREECIGRVLWELFPAAVGTPFYEALRRVAESGSAERFEHHYAPWDQWFENHVYPVPGGVCCAGRDITGTKRLEARLHLALEAAHMVAWEWDPKTDAVTMVGDVRAVYGSVALQSSRKAFELVHPDDAERHRRTIDDALASKGGYRSEFRLNLPDGQLLWLEERAAAVLDESGTRLTGVVTDITARKTMEDEIRRREGLLRTITDAMPGLIAYLDRDGRYRLCNEAYRTWFDVEPTSLFGKHIADVLGDEAYRAVEPHMASALAGRATTFESEIVYKTGERRWIEATYTPHRDAHGVVVGFVAFVRDITKKRAIMAESEALLARTAASEARLRRLVESGIIGIVFWTRDGDIRYANDAFLRTFGYTRDDLAAGRLRWREMTPREWAPLDERAFAEMAEHGVCTPYEKEYFHKDGRRVPILLGIAVWEDQADEGVAWILDMTERQRAERRRTLLVDAGQILAASIDVRETLVNAAKLVASTIGTLVIVDAVSDGNIGEPLAVVHRDPALQPAAEDLRRRTRLLPEHPGAVVARTGNSVAHTLDTNELERPDADPILRAWVSAFGLRSWVCVPLVSRGRVLGVLSYGTSDASIDPEDVATAEELGRRAGAAVDVARLFDASRAERARAEEASRAKDEFLAVVSHELRTPLNAILGWSTMLNTESLSEERRQHGLRVIERNARSQAQLVEDLLDISRITTGRVRLQVAQVELARVAQAAIESVRPGAAAKGVDIELFGAGEVGVVVGDGARLQQVAWNLLSNAVRHTKSGGRVELRLRRLESSVELSVRDTGEGIDPEFLPHVFERFRQAESGTTRRYGGLGLGLAIVKHLVELHGGTVHAESEGRGRGARFVVDLPIGSVPELAAPRATSASSPVPAAPRREPSGDLAGLHVLVVDDEDDARDLVRTIVERAGATVTTAASAVQALALLERQEDAFSVLVCDIGMPTVDGYELIRRIRALPSERSARIPAVAVTAFARTEDRARALREGFQLHLPKPVDRQELIDVLRAVTRTRG